MTTALSQLKVIVNSAWCSQTLVMQSSAMGRQSALFEPCHEGEEAGVGCMTSCLPGLEMILGGNTQEEFEIIRHADHDLAIATRSILHGYAVNPCDTLDRQSGHLCLSSIVH